MLKSSIVRSACCAVALFCGGVSIVEGIDNVAISQAVNEEGDVSLQYCNGRLGYYLVNFDGGVTVLGRKLKFKEAASRLGWTPELPTTYSELELFVNIGRALNAFSRLSMKIIFCCLEGKNLASKFQQLREFASFLNDCDNVGLKRKASNYLLFCLEEDLSQVIKLAKKHHLASNTLSIEKLVNEYNHLHTFLGS